MRKTLLIVFGFLFCLATSMAAARHDAQTKPPRALLSTNSVELGAVSGYEIRTVEFRLSNAGGAPLQIRGIVSTCGCISGQANKTILQPQEEGVIALRLNANQVNSAFSRSVWIETNDPDNPRFMLTLKGVVVPVFQGLPPMPICCRAIGSAAAWTNEITLTASETNTFLGLPTIQGRDFMQIDLTVKTNAAERMSYTLTTVIRPIVSEPHLATVTFPVIGRPGIDPGALLLQFQTLAGAELRVTPKRILFNPTGKTAPRRLIVQTSVRSANASLLRWAPAIEGVDISILPPGDRSNIFLTMTVSDKAAQRLLEKEKTDLTFSYPDHKPVKLLLEPMLEKRGRP